MAAKAKAAEIAALAAALEKASFAYHNGLPETMGDAEYDAAVDKLKAMAPTHPFLSKVGAPVAVGDEVDLPIPLPSLNKIKPDDGSLEKWLARNPAATYHASVKLDGVSALWIPSARKLFTRGDGMRGRDISEFAPFFHGIPAPASASAAAAGIRAVRGELIMYTDSPAVPAGKLARNIVAGAVNRKEVDPKLFAEIRFVAYAVEEPATWKPIEAFAALAKAGFEVAAQSIVPAAQMTPEALSALFTAKEEKSKYQIDGIVIAPNLERERAPVRIRKGDAVNPADRAAWKTRLSASTATTTVQSVEWNVASSGYLIPRVLFDTVTLSGANISAATGLHGKWIFENKVGPGAKIEIRRAGDVIPQIVDVLEAAPGGPAMPPVGTWEFVSDVHIRATDTGSKEATCARIVHALGALGAENVGPGLVAKLYDAGFTSVGEIYDASATDFAEVVEGVKEKGGERIYVGLRAAQDTWTDLTLMLASSVMPRGIGSRKLTPLFQINPDPASWSVEEFLAAAPSGISESTLREVVGCVDEFLAWKDDNFPDIVVKPFAAVGGAATGGAGTGGSAGGGAVVVLTGFRDKSFEAALVAKGHTVAESVTKKTTHVVFPDGEKEPTTGKASKGRDVGAQIVSLSAAKKQLL